MQTERFEDIDRSKWSAGPWDEEPDKAVWIDEATGLDCMIVRQCYVGHLCGYVGVSASHPFHGRGDHEIDDEIEVHGGLTYAEKCKERICHPHIEGRPDNIWWFGFDCAHGGNSHFGSSSLFPLNFRVRS